MGRKYKAYFTIEASLIMPLVLFLYLSIILAALFLYCRCAISQDDFLIGMRVARFTYGEDSYGEAIYGEAETASWSGEDYGRERLEKRKSFYPFFPTGRREIRIEGEKVVVKTWQKTTELPIEKKIDKCNPVAIIRERMGKNQNA